MAATRHGPVGDELLVRTLCERTSFAAHVTVVGNLSQAGAKGALSADVDPNSLFVSIVQA